MARSKNELIIREAFSPEKQGKVEFSHVTSDEVRRLIAKSRSEKTRLLLKTLWVTGARISEVLELTITDLDARRHTITIHRKMRGGKLSQALPIPVDLANELKLFIRTEQRRGRIFTGDRSSIYRTIRRMGKKILQRDISPHSFRHGRAYALVKKGVHPLLVSRALGHANLSSALAYYHPTDADLRRAMEETV